MSTEIESGSESIAQAIVPYFPEDSKKSRYLSYRVCGFTLREARDLAGVTETSIRRWRNSDPEFAKLDTTGLSELKEQLSAKYLNIEFTRNFHLVLQKDLKVLIKSLQAPEMLSTNENQYLLKLRAFYTPQQFAMIQQLVGEATGEGFDFTKLVFQIRREREEITISEER